MQLRTLATTLVHFSYESSSTSRLSMDAALSLSVPHVFLDRFLSEHEQSYLPEMVTRSIQRVTPLRTSDGRFRST